MSTVHTLGASGPDVGDVQRRLNAAAPTRLPRLRDDQSYGVLTMARVMEFQFLQPIEVDGACGRITRGRLPAAPRLGSTVIAPSGRCILVDLVKNRLKAFKDGTVELDISPIRGGSLTDPSTRGVFRMSSRRLRHHTSSRYPIPPDNMQFSLFYNRGEAIHQGPPSEPSHGCIHVGSPDAGRVFRWAGGHDILVIVVKRTR